MVDHGIRQRVLIGWTRGMTRSACKWRAGRPRVALLRARTLVLCTGLAATLFKPWPVAHGQESIDAGSSARSDFDATVGDSDHLVIADGAALNSLSNSAPPRALFVPALTLNSAADMECRCARGAGSDRPRRPRRAR